MNIFRQLVLSPLTAVLLTSTASALDTAERAGLDATLDAYEAALENEDFKTVVNTLPPRVIDLIADQAKLSPEVIRLSVTAQMSSVMAEADIQSFKMDTGAMTAGETKSGMNYAFLPTETVISQGGGETITANTLTLALEQDAIWYLMRIERPSHYEFVRAAYPDFLDVALPE